MKSRVPFLSKLSLAHAFNGAVMLAYRLGGAVVSFLVFALSMRKYGPELLGKYAYASAICQVVAPLLIGGVEPMLIRELVRRPSEKLTLLGSAFALVFFTTLVAVALPFSFAVISNPKDKDLIYMVIGLSLSLIPNCLLVLMSYFRSENRVTFSTLCGLGGVAVGAAVRLTGVCLGVPLYWIAAAAVLDPAVSGALLFAGYTRRYGSVTRWHISSKSMKQLFELSWSAVLSAFVVTVFFRLSHFMLKSLSTFQELGYYAIAFQMFTVLNFLPSSILSVIYPKLVQLHKDDLARYHELVRRTYVAATLGGIVICVAVWLWITPVLEMAFGPKSAPVRPIAFALAIANLFTFSGAVRSVVIYIEHRPVYHIYSTLAGLTVIVPANLILIPAYGAVGAAISVALACFTSAILTSWLFADLRPTALDQLLAFIGMRHRLPRSARSAS